SVRVAIKSAQISCYGIEQHDLSPFSVYCHSRRDRDLTFAFALHFKSLGYAPGMKQAIMPPPHFQVVVLLVFKILFAQELVSVVIQPFPRHGRSPFAPLQAGGEPRIVSKPTVE